MTLESYMEEFFKRKYAEEAQNSDQQSPEAVDPQVHSLFYPKSFIIIL